MQKFFDRIAQWTSKIAGTWGVFLLAGLIVIGWAILGLLMHFSDTWQLIISTISSVVTFLMVFLIQYAQNKDTKAIYLKLDELIRIHKKARNEIITIEHQPEEILEEEEEEISKLANQDKDSSSG